jgi:DNA-binding NarL/FixJ family response regulator
MKKIMIVDDHPLIRKGLAMTINSEPEYDVVGQAENASDGLKILEEHNPDLAIVDISLPGMSGLELIKNMQAINPDLLILVVSRHDETLYAERAIRAGAKGYVMKVEAGDVIMKAVRRVLNGGIYVSEQINERLLMGLASGYKPLKQTPLDVLSDRELEVFEMTGRGMSTREIAEKLFLSVKTVESYRARIKNKLNLSNANELVLHAVQWVEGEGAG